MSGAHGVKETKEALSGAFKLAAFLVVRLRDGIDLQDAAAVASLIQDEAFMSTMKEAVEGAKLIPDEAKELDAQDVLELASHLIEEVPLLLAAIKK